MKKLILAVSLLGSLGVYANETQRNLDALRNLDTNELREILSPESTDLIQMFQEELDRNPDIANNPQAAPVLAAVGAGLVGGAAAKLAEKGFEHWGKDRIDPLTRFDPRFFDARSNTMGSALVTRGMIMPVKKEADMSRLVGGQRLDDLINLGPGQFNAR